MIPRTVLYVPKYLYHKNVEIIKSCITFNKYNDTLILTGVAIKDTMLDN